MNSVMGVGVTGIQTGMSMLEQNGHKIANANVTSKKAESVEIAEPIVGLMESKILVQANSKVVEAGSETIGTLLDIKV